jgi:hypothetical protein
MRKFLVRLAIVLIVVGLLFLVWMIKGHGISLWLDSVGTTEVASTPLKSLTYEGSEQSGWFRYGDAILGFAGPDNKPVGLLLHREPDENYTLTIDGKSFPLGEGSVGASPDQIEFHPKPNDELVMVTRTGTPWPTFFQMNFMTGQAPSWKRNFYHRLRWRKPNGPKLRIVWRYEQFYYRGNGWTQAMMTDLGTTGVLHADIEL